MKTSSIVLSASFCVAGVTVPASAQLSPSEVVMHISVRYDDLDLKSGPGMRTLIARLDKAATKACGGKPAAPMPGDQVRLAMQDEHLRCKAAAMESSTLRLGSPLIRAAWLKKRAPSIMNPRDAEQFAHNGASHSRGGELSGAYESR